MTPMSDSSSLPKTKKPSDSAFKQQRLPAWQPILTAGTVLPTFFVIGVAFIPVGIGLLYFSDKVKEQTIDYTNCNSNNITYINGQPKTCADVIAENASKSCYCEIDFVLPMDFDGEVYMYYGLTNFYQNHRRYVKSRDDNQLLGILSDKVSNDCEPFAYELDEKNTTKPIAPCGAIANSLFSDELTLYSDRNKQDVPLLKTGIAWPSDKNIKFRNPEGDLKEAFSPERFAKPKNWAKYIYELDPHNASNNGLQNEDLIVWMRTAALPTFRKLYRRVDHSVKGFTEGLLAGNYTLKVKYSFSVSAFNGSKRMILSTTSLLGGKNPFLGIAYIVVGCICLVLGIALSIIHIKYSKSTAELINVTPTTEYQERERERERKLSTFVYLNTLLKMNKITRAIFTLGTKYPKYSTLPPEIVVFTDKDMIICWHPNQGFPYEYSQPILEEVKAGPNTVLKIGEKDVSDIFRKKKDSDVIEELSKLTFTTKHRWFPRSRDKKAKKTEPDRPYL
ncbi:hypothetical protein KPH14_002766 [Odynerus spinipes]|uniref:P4-ATPase flippase complex beta subunit TMEM30A n=1 Tax=Odynerus spinipes TaxID=1348599 RepID=A0AAD9VP89_9HYME|nr:hypothetical protein KPH14_002766 [Odynerus spinipes]